ncbi:MAG: hypothetical protein ACXWG4_12795, partial [Thermoanaerobaculia bacterium]
MLPLRLAAACCRISSSDRRAQQAAPSPRGSKLPHSSIPSSFGQLLDLIEQGLHRIRLPQKS